MSTYLVTVEVATSLTGDAGREYARDLLERRGLVVTSVRAVKGKDSDWSGYTPKAGRPGSVVVRDGRRFQVWAPAPGKDSHWLIPLDPRPGDAPMYRSFGQHTLHAVSTRGESLYRHSDGSWSTQPERRAS